MPAHKITVTLDEATGAVTVRHYCREPFTHPGTGETVAVTVWEDVPADPKLAEDLKALLEPNRKAMAGRAATAVMRSHLAAVDELEKAAAKAAKAKARGEAPPTE